MSNNFPTLCADCEVDTTPCSGRRGCRHDRWEYYMVTDELWSQYGAGRGYLCIACLEIRVSRLLNADDFSAAPINRLDDWDTPRLRAAKTRLNPFGDLREVMEMAWGEAA